MGKLNKKYLKLQRLVSKVTSNKTTCQKAAIALSCLTEIMDKYFKQGNSEESLTLQFLDESKNLICRFLNVSCEDVDFLYERVCAISEEWNLVPQDIYFKILDNDAIVLKTPS